jgi:hypothetical protein
MKLAWDFTSVMGNLCKINKRSQNGFPALLAALGNYKRVKSGHQGPKLDPYLYCTSRHRECLSCSGRTQKRSPSAQARVATAQVQRRKSTLPLWWAQISFEIGWSMITMEKKFNARSKAYSRSLEETRSGYTGI